MPAEDSPEEDGEAMPPAMVATSSMHTNDAKDIGDWGEHGNATDEMDGGGSMSPGNFFAGGAKAAKDAGARMSRRASFVHSLDPSAFKATNMDEEAKDKGTKMGVLVDPDTMKDQVRQKLCRPQYRVTDYYHDEGCSQRIGKSMIFDKITLGVIAFNAIWIAIDTDMNDADILSEADPMFIIAENLFCSYFVFEWTVRFCSFKKKSTGCKDAWFLFDSFMVSMMVLETWIFTGIVTIMGSGGNTGGANVGLLRLARLLRLSRMARMGKLLRVMPELLIMLKGMKAAMRSVFWTLILLLLIMYVFAILFVQLGEDTAVGDQYFNAVPQSMYTLLVFGVFLDDIRFLTDKLKSEWVLAIIFFCFVLLAALTVMNMLIGVLCEVVSAVAATEREEMLVQHVNDRISRVMAIVDTDGSGSISKTEFSQIVVNSEAVKCLSDVGVDVFALIDLADYIFLDDDNAEVELDFGRFMEIVLKLRGSNTATVKDIVDLRKFMRLQMQENQAQTALILEKLRGGAQFTEDFRASMTTQIQRTMSTLFNSRDSTINDRSGDSMTSAQMRNTFSSYTQPESQKLRGALSSRSSKSSAKQDRYSIHTFQEDASKEVDEVSDLFDLQESQEDRDAPDLSQPPSTQAAKFLTESIKEGAHVVSLDGEVVSLTNSWEVLNLTGCCQQAKLQARPVLHAGTASERGGVPEAPANVEDNNFRSGNNLLTEWPDNQVLTEDGDRSVNKGASLAEAREVSTLSHSEGQSETKPPLLLPPGAARAKRTTFSDTSGHGYRL